MGFGDELMALGRAELLHLQTEQRVRITDATGKTRKNDLWNHHPAIAAPDDYRALQIVDAPGHRPYIERWDGRRCVFNRKHRPHAGRVHLTAREEEFAADLEDIVFAVVSPSVKETASPNKDWGEERWQEVISDFPITVLQLGPEGEPTLPGAIKFPTPTMRHAAAVVALSKIVLTNEGGLHHLAASMGRPAVVVHGGFTDPAVTGYPSHTNLTGNTGHSACGKWEPCADCRNALDKITPAMVKEAAKGMLHGKIKTKSLRRI